MDFYNYLTNTYGFNEPIFLSDIKYKTYSRPWLFKELSRLCDDEKVIRFEKGVYYIPQDTLLGKSMLDPRKVIRKKYIENEGQIFGYYSGGTLLNMMNLSTQMPNSIEIVTNNEKTKRREIKVGSQRVILHRARTQINNSNAAVLQFLELMNTTQAPFLDADRKRIIYEYLRRFNIRRNMITEYAPVFPDKAMRNLVESEVIYDVAS